MKYIRYVANILIQCTWGCVQTFVGFLFFLKYIRCPHYWYRGSIVTKWKVNHFSGLSLGMFIFIPDENADFFKETGWSDEKIQDEINRCLVHEYGHVMQSLILGPFMLYPGIVSVAWGRMKRFERLRREYQVPYNFCWVEEWANKLGEKVTGCPSIGLGTGARETTREDHDGPPSYKNSAP